MSITILVFIFIVGIYLHGLQQRRLARAFLATGFAFLVIVAQGWMPGYLMAGLQSAPPLLNPEWKQRNAIVVLGTGAVKWPEAIHYSTHALGYSRLHETARLYRLCKQTVETCTVLATGGDPKQNGISEAEVMKRELMEIGVSESDLVVESKSNNTFQNARFSSEILKSLGFDQVILVTSGLHLRRAILYFSHFGLKPVGAPSDRLEPIDSYLPLAHNLAFNDIALHEYTGLLRYRLYNWMGWNSATSQPGSP